MSTFHGKIKHFPATSIDRFDGENEKSEVFFLSHCHTDHMVGLHNINGPLHLSPVSALFIKDRYPHIENIIELEIGVPMQIKTSQGSFVVTTFPAYHCPGSVMFLFQNHELNILYTGDIRLNGCDLEKMKALKEYQNNIDEMHLDSTFLNEDYLEFPSQEKSVEAIADLIKEWIDVGDEKRKIFLSLPARFGAEWIFIKLYNILKKQIYVGEPEYASYRYIPDMDQAITLNPKNVQIHACFKRDNNNCACIQFTREDNVRTIRISALTWTNWNSRKSCVEYNADKKSVKVCYSNHSSFTELKETIHFFKPKEIFLNVLPSDETQRDRMMNSLDKIMKDYKEVTEQSNNEETPIESEIKISFSNVPKFGKRRSETDLNDTKLIQIPRRKRLFEDVDC